MRRILNCCLVGLCGTLVFACWSPSNWRKDTPRKAVQPAAAVTPASAQTAELKPSTVEAAPLTETAPSAAPAPVAAPAPATGASKQSESYQNTDPGMAPQGEPPEGQPPAQPPTATEEAPDAMATATLENAKDKEVGKVRFEQDGQMVVMTGTFSDLPPGKHGIQLRENGDCGGKRFSRAGGHFNPTKSKHGPPEAAERHVGDFGNISVAKDGTAQFEMRTDAMTIREGETSVVGRSVVITSKADNGKAQANGNAGHVIACGVVRAEAPAEQS